MAPAQLPSTMKAAVCLEVKGKTEVRDLKMPVPAAGEVLIKNISAGICHTDLHAMDGHIGFPIPAVFGHEVVILFYQEYHNWVGHIKLAHDQMVLICGI